ELFEDALLPVAVLATSEDPPHPATARPAVDSSPSAVSRRDRVLIRKPPRGDVLSGSGHRRESPGRRVQQALADGTLSKPSWTATPASPFESFCTYSIEITRLIDLVRHRPRVFRHSAC